MKKNKTPMQELICWIDETNQLAISIDETYEIPELVKQFKEVLTAKLEKEKQFAFDCFEASRMLDDDQYHYLYSDFDEFYSEYKNEK